MNKNTCPGCEKLLSNKNEDGGLHRIITYKNMSDNSKREVWVCKSNVDNEENVGCIICASHATIQLQNDKYVIMCCNKKQCKTNIKQEFSFSEKKELGMMYTINKRPVSLSVIFACDRCNKIIFDDSCIILCIMKKSEILTCHEVHTRCLTCASIVTSLADNSFKEPPYSETLNCFSCGKYVKPIIDMKTNVFLKSCENTECISLVFHLISKANEYLELSRITRKSCEKCLKNMKTSGRCSNCDLVYYCSIECQKEHWVIHKKECKKF